MRRLLAGVAVFLLPCACTQGPVAQTGFGRAPTVFAVRDAYAIAHGMAFSYAGSDDADPAIVAQLVRLDARAMGAVRLLDRTSQGSSQGSVQARETAEAVAALTEFAARQTATPQ